MTTDGQSAVTRELAMAADALKGGNHGKARVCARRAVGLAADAWLVSRQVPSRRGDAMSHLRHVQQQPSIPLAIREAAERLITSVTRRDVAPFADDPIGDANVIIAYLNRADSVL